MKIHLANLLLVVCAFDVLRCEEMTAEEEELLTTDIELDEFEFEEHCAQGIPFAWSRLVQRNYNSKEALSGAEDFAKAQREGAKKFFVRLQDDSPTRDAETGRKLDLISRPGDVLLPPDKYKQLLVFQDKVQDDIAKKRRDCNISSTMNCDLTSDDPVKLLDTWSRLSIVGTDAVHKEYPRILGLVPEAAKLNGVPDAKSYWLMLSDLDSYGYDQAQTLWEDVKPLYQKLHHWVAVKLQNKYGKRVLQDVNEAIPLYLLESYLGNDWTTIADIVLSGECSNTLKNIEKTLDEKEMNGKRLYEQAETLTGYLHLGKAPKVFWTDSEFDHSCPARHIDPCRSGVRVSACNKASWSNYLDAHRIMMERAYTQITEISSLSYILKNGNRYSAVYDAVSTLTEILASSRHYMAQYGLVTPTDDCALQTILSLTALRVLPSLPYYLVADLSRLQAIKSNSIDNIGVIWQKLQLEMQRVSTPGKEWWGFLEDTHITSNQPYINKFYAVFLQFHLFEELMTNDEESFADAEEFLHKKEEFKTLLASGISQKWTKLIDNIFNIKTITSAPLLRFFSRFEATLDPLSPKIPKSKTPSETTSVTTSVTKRNASGVIVDIQVKDHDLNVSLQEEDAKSISNNIFEGLGVGTYVLFSFLILVGIVILVVIAKLVWKRTRTNYEAPTHQNEPAEVLTGH